MIELYFGGLIAFGVQQSVISRRRKLSIDILSQVLLLANLATYVTPSTIQSSLAHGSSSES